VRIVHPFSSFGLVAAALAVGACAERDISVITESEAETGSVAAAVINLDDTSALPPCGTNNQAQVYYVAQDAKFYYCEAGSYQIIDLQPEPGGLVETAPAPACPNGGVLLRTGRDTDRDGKLSATEVVSSKAVCNGINGINGTNGINGINGANGINGINGSACDGETCTGACTVVDNGDRTKTVSCADGSSVTVAAEPATHDGAVLLNILPEPRGANCAFGGNLIQVGTDLDSNGVLDAGEVTDSDYACAPGDVTADHTAPLVSRSLEGDRTLVNGVRTLFSANFSDDVAVVACVLEYGTGAARGTVDAVLGSNDGGLTGLVRASTTFPDLSALSGGGAVDWTVRFVCRDAAGNPGAGEPVTARVLPAAPAGTCAFGGAYQQTVSFNAPVLCATPDCLPETCARLQTAIEEQDQYVAELSPEAAESLGNWSSDRCTRVNHATGLRGECRFDYNILLTHIDGTCAEPCPQGSTCGGGRCLAFCTNDGAVPYDTSLQTCLACGNSTSVEPLGSSCPSVVWPNPLGPSNSSAWLRENHDRLTELRPRVLILDVSQGPAHVPVEELASGFIAATEAETTYHGYSDPTGKPFVHYEVDRIIDLKDPAGAAHPATWPVVQRDIGPLFAESFAPVLGYAAPEDPTRFMPMCELFERGIINELWIAADEDRNLFENQSRLQMYDANFQPIDGQFNVCTNGCYVDPARLVNCKVSVRMQELNKTRGPGCATHAAGHALETLGQSIPYLADNAARFFGQNLDKQYGLGVTSLYPCPYDSPTACVEHPFPSVMTSGPAFPGPAFFLANWGAGCGNVHFPPNATGQYDYAAPSPALSTCASYGLGESWDRSDVKAEYSTALVAEYEAAYGRDATCGGGWMVYMGQSMPGFGNKARDAKGQPMKNWWPFLFY
jgi:hypothetical protein